MVLATSVIVALAPFCAHPPRFINRLFPPLHICCRHSFFFFYYLIRTVSLSPRHRSCPPTRLPSPPPPAVAPPPHRLLSLILRSCLREKSAPEAKVPGSESTRGSERSERRKTKTKKKERKNKRSAVTMCLFFLLSQAAGQQLRATR